MELEFDMTTVGAIAFITFIVIAAVILPIVFGKSARDIYGSILAPLEGIFRFNPLNLDLPFIGG